MSRTPPRNVDLLMQDETGRKFLGRYASLDEIWPGYLKKMITAVGFKVDMSAPRWFEFRWKAFEPCAAPVAWMEVAEVTLEGGIAGGCG